MIDTQSLTFVDFSTLALLEIDMNVIVDNSGDPLAIRFGLDDSTNYFLSNNRTLARDGFVVIPSIGKLVDELDATITGQVSGIVKAEFVGVPGGANAFIQFDIADMNNILDPKKRSSAVSVFYKVNINFSVPSFLDILLMDPNGIVEAIDGVSEPLLFTGIPSKNFSFNSHSLIDFQIGP